MTDPEIPETSGERPDKGLPLPSPDPATNLLIADIVLRGAGRVLRETLEKRMLVANYDPDKARELVDGRTVLTSLAVYGASKLAARSTPGLALVAGGLALKALYDRGKSIQLLRREQETPDD
ncbi:MAG: hypothetical protein QNJ15_14110 [Erythrobacter sp.]|nr:hypothetical protein [Erythrobacter sp.]